VAGSASAEMSAMARSSQLVDRPCWKSGFGSYGEQPLPPSAHASSPYPRGELSEVSVVPPTATTWGLVAGQLVTLPASPVLAVTATPGWS
jgi:hypothetical protein